MQQSYSLSAAEQSTGRVQKIQYSKPILFLALQEAGEFFWLDTAIPGVILLWSIIRLGGL